MINSNIVSNIDFLIRGFTLNDNSQLLNWNHLHFITINLILHSKSVA